METEVSESFALGRLTDILEYGKCELIESYLTITYDVSSRCW